jgi:predicted RNA-binding Zn-ribbon protein involved in translation (DUF1610 family)
LATHAFELVDYAIINRAKSVCEAWKTLGIKMAATKRPQNECKSCGYTWYPRGKSLSNKCPSCGSSETSKVKSWGGLIALIIAGYVIFGGEDKPTQAEVEVTAPSNASSAVESSSAQAVESSKGFTLSSTTESQENRLTPSSRCASESNFFSRNNCEWRECEKSEFSELKECENKKPKDNQFGN